MANSEALNYVSLGENERFTSIYDNLKSKHRKMMIITTNRRLVVVSDTSRGRIKANRIRETKIDQVKEIRWDYERTRRHLWLFILLLILYIAAAVLYLGYFLIPAFGKLEFLKDTVGALGKKHVILLLIGGAIIILLYYIYLLFRKKHLILTIFSEIDTNRYRLENTKRNLLVMKDISRSITNPNN